MPANSPRRDLLSHLEAGSTGCLHAEFPGGVQLSVFVMPGQILAAHASDDRDALLRLLRNSGAAESARFEALAIGAPTDRSITEELFELVPEEVVQDMLAERFRENLFRYLQCASSARFEELETTFVENIQVGHESRGLIDELDDLVQATARLRGPPGLVLSPGGGTMREARQRTLAVLCSPRLALADLLQRSPWEAGRTLALVGEMLERGVLVPVTARENEGHTDKPMPRPALPAAKVTAGTGRVDPLSRDLRRSPTRAEGPRDAVAAALATAVSAAVAKVGRQRDGTSPPVPASALDPISAPTARPEPKPAAVAIAPAPVTPPKAAGSVAPPQVPAKPAQPDATEPAPLPPKARPPAPPADEEDELAAFQDYDHDRQGGEFMTAMEHLERVEVVTLAEPPKPRRAPPAGWAWERRSAPCRG